ncbi:hypothetical protein SDC9_122647 [bioreactor metagenome]|uniref:Uncharacterized protein n=1 Tax=bioreactor metagenome TaxID=1076179 RepID=A0A645CFH9_9ZZZZ
MLEVAQAGFLPHQQQAGIRMMFKKLAARRKRDAWAMIAPHAVDSQCDHLGEKSDKANYPKEYGQTSKTTKARATGL